MTVDTSIPFPIMRAAVNGEIHTIVVESSRCPRILRVASLTVGRKTGTLVVRIVGPVVIPAMTSKAGVGRIAVITPDMAGHTGVRNRSVRTHQRVKIIVIKT
jgi:hypothetical protein